jgi:aspartate/tyrosine/aromatic aminotransferase
MCRLQLSKVNIPSAAQLNKQIDQRYLEKCIKQLAKCMKSATTTKLFSLYKYRVKGAYNSCMHHYKRDLTPVREQFAN